MDGFSSRSRRNPFLFRNAERRKVATIARSSKPSLLYIYIYYNA